MKIETKFNIGQKVWIITDSCGPFTVPEIRKDIINEIIIKKNCFIPMYKFKNCGYCLSGRWISKTKRGIKKIFLEMEK